MKTIRQTPARKTFTARERSRPGRFVFSLLGTDSSATGSARHGTKRYKALAERDPPTGRRNLELICETAQIIAESARLIEQSRKLLSPVGQDQH
ncbi:MAG: hypothetical protein E5Y51_10725 [Mesorhizobium sp.]|uniref:hypothetical protein n=1 Tax=Mesorhizobium sp. M1A.F.Ca.IN.022.06.1.1 TaxID=2493680 RepID=UPI000F75DD32|nr:hypothetical protein [Mesorhizobium sp. M1A.F.Ca.IN.022.06.1.1]AZO63018.1 hypothetical protein EJ078_30160 [Mesorhizobium sp. M1A.F.Ca.IN.022.06.1.1]TIN17337.1 MAG: hypothetical protein E5Y51_10725 [Mesorhizobium sp.]